MIKQAIIPLAGLGTRMLPLTKAFPKELWPLGSKSILENILDECFWKMLGICQSHKSLIMLKIITKGSLLLIIQHISIKIMRFSSKYLGGLPI